MKEHHWPIGSAHVWGKWMPKNRTTIWRACVHPECSAIEEKDAKS